MPSGTFKRFAQQNLAAGRIHFARGCSIKGFPQGLQPLWENDLPWSMCAMMEKFRMFFSFIAVAPVCCRQGDAARQMARPSVLPPGKTLPQGEFVSPEDVQSKGFPQGLQPLWENDLPWSMCAMMEKFRMFFSFIAVAPVCCRQGGAARQMARPSVLPQGKFLFPAEQGIRLFFGAVEYLRHALHEAGVEGRERFILH